MESEVNTFQAECESLIRDVAVEMGASVVDRRIEGGGEKYIHALVEPGPIEIWIYDDEVQYRVAGRRYDFEMAYYRNPKRLFQELCGALREDLGANK